MLYLWGVLFIKRSRKISIQGDYLKKYFFSKEYLFSTAEYIRRIQRMRLEKIVQHAMTHSEFYRELYSNSGISINNISEIQVTDLPIVDKQLVMDNFDSVVCDKLIKKEELLSFISNPENANSRFMGKYTVIHTSGSSGKLGLFVYDDKDINTINVLFSKYTFHLKPLFRMLMQRVVFLGAVNGHYAAYTSFSRFSDYRIPFLPISVETPIEHIIQQLNAFQPTIIIVYSSMLPKLAAAQIEGQLNISPKTITTAGEILTSNQIDISKKAFGITPRSIYGASESIIIGADTFSNGGMCLFNNWNLMETVGENDEPVIGDYGLGVLTNLYNYIVPLIRYRMDDILLINRNPVNRTLPFEVIEGIKGRTEDFLEFNVKGKKAAIHPIVFVEFYVKGLKQIQVIKKNVAHFKAVVSLTEHTEEVIHEIRKRLQDILDNQQVGHLVHFDIEVVDEIPNDPRTGKFKLVVNQS